MERSRWLDDRRNVRKVLAVLYAVCAALLSLDLFYDKHATLWFEAWFGFYAFYDFVACATLVLVAKVLRKLLSRPADYYEGGTDAG